MDVTTRGIWDGWQSAFDNAPDQNHKNHAALVLNQHYDHLDIQDDGKLNDSVTEVTPPPLPAGGTTPPPGSGTTPPPGSGTTPPPGSGTTPPPGSGTTPPPGSGTTPPPGSEPPLLKSLDNQFGIKDQVLTRNGGDFQRAEAWLQKNGYDKWADGVVEENGQQKIQKGSEFWDLYTKAFNAAPPDKDVASYPSSTTLPEPAADPTKAKTPLLDSLDNQFDIKGRILRINDNDPAKAEAWLQKSGYDKWADGVTAKPGGGQSIEWGSEFHYLYTQAYGLEVPPGTFDSLKAKGYPV